MQLLYASRRWRALFLGLGGVLAATATGWAQGPQKQWDQTIGGNHSDYFAVLRATPDGGYLLGGSSHSGVSGAKSQPNLGNTDYWVVKIDSTGRKQWDQTIGGSNGDQLTTLELTADGGYLLGGFSNSPASANKSQGSRGDTDYWIVKLNAQGQQQWDRTYGGSENEALRVVRQTRDGGYILGGNTRSGLSGDKTQPARGIDDYWLVKIDAVGNKLWDRTYGGPDGDLLTGLVQTPDGGYALAGNSWSGAGADKTQPNHGRDADLWVLKVDAQGTKLWDRTFGGSSYDICQDLQLTPDDGLILGGWSNSGADGDKTAPSRGGNDYWALKIDSNGHKMWDAAFGGSTQDQLYRLQPTTDGGYILGGRSYSGISGDKTQPHRGGDDYWLVKIDANGQQQWDYTAGGSGNDFFFDVRQAADGGYLLGGYSDSPASGDKTQGNFTPASYVFDWWVVKITGTVSTAQPTPPPAPTPPPVVLRPTAPPKVLVYPNPAREFITVQLPDAAPHADLRLTLYNPAGQVLLRQRLGPAIDFSIPVLLGAQQPGLYLLRLDGPEGYQYSQRLALE
jgi:hypothetical protein